MARPFTQIWKFLAKAKKAVGGKRLAILILIILILGWRVIATRPTEWKLETTEVARGELVESVSASGEVNAMEIANLTFQTSGKLVWVGIKEGDRVVAGQGIAQLDTLALSAAYQQALNNYRDKQALAEKAEDDVKDHSGDETFAQKATRTTAQVARDNAYDAVRSAEQALRFATLISPINGVVTGAAPMVSGINVTSASAVYTIINPETLYFEAQVNEVDIPKISLGQKVLVYLDAYPDEAFEGSVRDIGFQSTTTSTGGTAYKVWVGLPQNTDSRFKIGMNGDAEFTLETKENVLLVPGTAVVEEKHQTYVWIVDTSGRAQRTEVKIGSSSIDNIEIASGLSAGVRVVTRPPTKIKTGDVVNSTRE